MRMRAEREARNSEGRRTAMKVKSKVKAGGKLSLSRTRKSDRRDLESDFGGLLTTEIRRALAQIHRKHTVICTIPHIGVELFS
jgi:hypothetical protein